MDIFEKMQGIIYHRIRAAGLCVPWFCKRGVEEANSGGHITLAKWRVATRF